MALLCALATGAATARPLPDGGVSAQEVAGVLLDRGYKAEIGKDSAGDPTVASTVQGVNYKVYFYGCSTAKRCTSIQFSAGFDLNRGMSLERVNQWNKEKRFGRVYLDTENDPYIEMDIDLEKGGTTEAVANNLETWSAVVSQFKGFIQS